MMPSYITYHKMNGQTKEILAKVATNIAYNKIKGEGQSVKDVASFGASEALNTMYLADMVRPMLPGMLKADPKNPNMQIVEDLATDLIGVGFSYYAIENYVRKNSTSVMQVIEQVVASDIGFQALKKVNLI
jgi:hypothetical protein